MRQPWRDEPRIAEPENRTAYASIFFLCGLFPLAVKKKMCMHEHRTSASISVQTLAGHIRLKLPDRTVELLTGQLLVLDQCVPHDVEAEEDSAFLLTLSWHGQESKICQID